MRAAGRSRLARAHDYPDRSRIRRVRAGFAYGPHDHFGERPFVRFLIKRRRRAAGRAHRRARALAVHALLLGSLLLVSGASPAAAQRPTLDTLSVMGRLKEIIRRSSPELAARRAAVAAAEARLGAIGLAPAASLAAEIEEVPSGLNVASAHSMRLDIAKEFLPPGLRAARRILAQGEIDRARAELGLAGRALNARIDRLLVHAVASAAIARRLAAEDSLLRAAEEGVRVRFAVGDARYVDVLRLRTERLRVQTEVAAALTEARIERRTLIALAAMDEPEVMVSSLGDSIIGEGMRAAVFAELAEPPSLDSLMARSGSVRIAEIELSRARASRELLRAEQRPSFGASIGIQRFATDGGGFVFGPSAGLSMSLPFTTRRANRAVSLAADRDVVTAETWHRAIRASVRSELASALDRYEAARARVSLFEAALLRGAREERESALASYRTGELSLVELLDFERALSRAEISRLRSYMEAADAVADLISTATDAETRFEQADFRLDGAR